MRMRWVLLLTVLVIASCRWFRGESAPDASAARPEQELKSPEQLRAEELEKRVAALKRHLPPSSDNATASRDAGQGGTASLGPDIEPLPLPLPEPEVATENTSQPKVEAPPAAVPTMDLLIAALEAKPDKTPGEVFRLKALRALAGAETAPELLAKLYAAKDLKRFEQPWHDLASALDATSRKQADEALRELRDAERELVKSSSIRMGKPVFAKLIRGFGNYEPLPSSVFRKGQTVLVYFELGDFVSKKDETGWEYHLAREVVIMDMAGRTVATAEKSDSTYTSRSQQREIFWPLRFSIPKDIYPGEYLLRISVTDKLKNQVAEEKVPFEVR